MQDPIVWKSDESVWVNQWPLTQEKLQASQKLVQEHTTSSNSSWNSSIFIIKKKSGK